MALFTDGPPATVGDLKRHESSILEAARSEGIDLQTKLELAAEEVGDEILTFLLGREERDPHAGRRRAMGLKSVAATQTVRRWHALHTLAMVYRDAYNSQLNDRFEGKWREYARLAAAAGRQAFEIGIGVVRDPVERASSPEAGWTAGSNASETYYLRVSWVDGAGREGAASLVTTYETPAGSQLTVKAVNAPANAAGWNVFAGSSASTLAQQNGALLSPGETWTLAGGLAAGRAPGEGQAPDVFVVWETVLRRG